MTFEHEDLNEPESVATGANRTSLVHKLHTIFAANFSRDDLQAAKAWARKWSREWNQHLHEIGIIHQRAMAGHISDYLEGLNGTEPDSYGGSDLSKTYLTTKHGPEIFWVM